METNKNIKTEIPYGYCHCGCGQKTKIIKRNDFSRNKIKGTFEKFVKNHNKRKEFCKNGHFRSVDNITKDGYCKLCKNEYRRNNKGGRQQEYKKRIQDSINNSNSYIIRLLNNKKITITPEIIELKRMMIKLSRAKRAYLKGEKLNGN